MSKLRKFLRKVDVIPGRDKLVTCSIKEKMYMNAMQETYEVTPKHTK